VTKFSSFLASILPQSIQELLRPEPRCRISSNFVGFGAQQFSYLVGHKHRKRSSVGWSTSISQAQPETKFQPEEPMATRQHLALPLCCAHIIPSKRSWKGMTASSTACAKQACNIGGITSGNTCDLCYFEVTEYDTPRAIVHSSR